MAPSSSRTFPTCGGGCGASFDDHDHLPLLLPCGHGHCKSCLSNMEDMDRQQCPTCKADWSHLVLAELPTVFDMIDAHHIDVNAMSHRRGSTTESVTGRDESAPVTPGPNGMAVMPQPVAGEGGPAGMAVMPAPAARGDAPAAATETGQSGSVSSRQVMPAPLEEPVCNICMDPYNNKTEQPLLLPCGHCFCRFCLSELKVAQGNKSTCPKCRKPWGHLNLSVLPVVKSFIHPMTVMLEPTVEFIKTSGSCSRTSFVEIYVNDASRNKTVTVQLRLSDTVERLRVLAGQRFGSGQACQQPLQYNGRTMESNKTLQDYGVTAFQTIRMTCRLAGGANV